MKLWWRSVALQALRGYLTHVLPSVALLASANAGGQVCDLEDDIVIWRMTCVIWKRI
jgi:hypothetical protein